MGLVWLWGQLLNEWVKSIRKVGNLSSSSDLFGHSSKSEACSTLRPGHGRSVTSVHISHRIYLFFSDIHHSLSFFMGFRSHWTGITLVELWPHCRTLHFEKSLPMASFANSQTKTLLVTKYLFQSRPGSNARR